jgi:hypothetical protein
MGVVIYTTCMLTALLCAYLLFRAYLRSRHRLLLWSALCFAGLTVNNSLLVLDKLLLPQVDLALPRTLSALFAMVILLYGLIWDSER